MSRKTYLLRMFSYFIVFSLLLTAINGWGCGEEPVGPKECQYEHQCADNERCIYEDPSCVARTGQCKGTCVPQEPVPEKSCQCKKDEDCKDFPAESCLNCKCNPRPVQKCASDKECIRGWYCLGEPGKAICQPRSNCKKDEDCPFRFVCRDESCCNPETNSCANTCEEGAACESDVDCYFCNMRCKDKKCSFDGSDPCAGVKCINDSDCGTCNGICKAGYCQVSATPTCLGKKCEKNDDCSACGSNCKDGICKEKEQPTCTTLSCVEDADCKASGLTSCIEKCCQ